MRSHNRGQKYWNEFELFQFNSAPQAIIERRYFYLARQRFIARFIYMSLEP